jgi:cytochrome P450
MPSLTADAPDILSEEHDHDPEIAYRYLRDEAPCVYHAGSDSYLVTRHADVLRLLRGTDTNSQNYGDGLGLIFGRTVLELDGKEHQKHRLLLNPIFHTAEITSLRPTMLSVITSMFLPQLEAATAAFQSGDAESANLDLVPAYFGELPISVIEVMLDLPKDKHEDFSRWYKAFHAFTANLSGDPGVIERGLKAREEMTEYVLPLILERRANPGNDLISQMCTAEVDGEKLTDEEVRAFVSLMITAGGETTDRALGLMTLNLLRHPDQLAAVRENRDLIVNAFVETMRYTPPVGVAARQAAVDIELHGVTIPAGSKITLLIAAANRDPRKFSDPDTFDIFRSDSNPAKGFTGAADHLGFANGRHFCVGAQLAKAEIEIAFNMIFDNMKDLRLAEGFVPQPTGLWTRGVDNLVVSYTPA